MIILDKIKLLVNALPSRDVNLALSFIDVRNFESLLELINSDIILVELNMNAEKSNPMYDVCVLTQIIELQELVTVYIDGITIPELEGLEDEY